MDVTEKQQAATVAAEVAVAALLEMAVLMEMMVPTTAKAVAQDLQLKTIV
jgi:hypothetical protein